MLTWNTQASRHIISREYHLLSLVVSEKDRYSTKAYYGDDDLGIDVLKQKYLAPWEKHPHELWQRQAKALASVEKTKSLRTKMEKEFLNILEDFRFVPGGRIMHGAGREDITTTLNNCYVVAVRNDSIKSIYEKKNHSYHFPSKFYC